MICAGERTPSPRPPARWPSWHRPPYGIFSAGSLAATRRLGFAPLLWSRWGRDWRARRNRRGDRPTRLRATPEAGDILLLHDSDAYSAPGSWRATAAALPMILDSLARQQLGARNAALSGEGIRFRIGQGCPIRRGHLAARALLGLRR
ncbi:MAG: hypothetical protein WKF40_10360 [Thermoleophilaceae bacterium]